MSLKERSFDNEPLSARFFSRIDEKISLWESMIAAADISEEAREEFRDKVSVLNSRPLYADIIRDFPDTEIRILEKLSEGLIQEGEPREDIVTLFRILKEDFEAFGREIMPHYY